MNNSNSSGLITPNELNQMMEQSSPFIFDSSWLFNPPPNRVPKEEYQTVGHIPTAYYFDIDACAAPAPFPLTHTLPSEVYFHNYVKKLVSEKELSMEESPIIVYDSTGIFSAARVWWLFKTFGYKNVSLLNGGLGNWIASGFPLEKGVWDHPFNTTPQNVMQMISKEVGEDSNTYPQKSYPQNCKTYQDMKKYVEDFKNSTETNETNTHPLILDARASARFHGQGPERANLPSGHIPYSANLFFGDFLETHEIDEDTVQKLNLPFKTFTTMPTSPETLLKLFKSKTQNVEETKTQLDTLDPSSPTPIVFTCGSGVTAAVLNFFFIQMGWDWDKTHLYDGSWTEWASYQSGLLKE